MIIKTKTSTDGTIKPIDTVGYRGTLGVDGSMGKRNKAALNAAYNTSPMLSTPAYSKTPVGNKHDGAPGKISYESPELLKAWFMTHVVNGVVHANLNMGLTEQSLEYAGNGGGADPNDAAPNLSAIDVTKATGINTLNPYVPNLKSPGEGQWTGPGSQPGYADSGDDIPNDYKTGEGASGGNGQASLVGKSIVDDSNLLDSAADVIAAQPGVPASS